MKKKLIISGLTLLLTLTVFSIPTLEEGKLIFNKRCAACHNVNKTVTGPALAGVEGRHSIDWIIKFVHSSQTVIKSGDTSAVALYEKFNKIPMPDHGDLSEDNIRGILAYIKTETNTSTESQGFRPERLHPSYTPLTAKDADFFIWYMILIVMLAAAMVALVRVKEIQRKAEK